MLRNRNTLTTTLSNKEATAHQLLANSNLMSSFFPMSTGIDGTNNDPLPDTTFPVTTPNE
jgi:hypothetical protein